MKFALGIEYSGENYCGWQKQKHSPSVQEQLERVLSQISAQTVNVFCAGRTDTGVHATNQVVHFEIDNFRPESAWIRGANNYLPDDISIVWSKEVDNDFHARFSATSRSYRYVIYNSPSKSATLSKKVTWCRQHLDQKLMHEGATYLLGTNDFTSFRASSCQANTAQRTVESVTVSRCNNLIFIDIKANAFLHHMVRNIAGCLVQIGLGKFPPSFVDELLKEKDRKKAPDTARPDGLYLVNVGYPKAFNIPERNFAPLGGKLTD